MVKKFMFIILGSMLALSACSNGDEKNEGSKNQENKSHMKHNDESKPPKDMKSTHQGKFKPGDKVTSTAGHMPGMKGVKANIDDVKETNVYMVDYKSKDNDKTVKNHKWMTGNELKAR